MRLKIRCDGESGKFYKNFWELNKAIKKTSPTEKFPLYPSKKVYSEKQHH